MSIFRLNFELVSFIYVEIIVFVQNGGVITRENDLVVTIKMF